MHLLALTQAASFNAFLSRPENRELALQAQAEEAQAAIEAAEAAQYDTFLDKVICWLAMQRRPGLCTLCAAAMRAPRRTARDLVPGPRLVQVRKAGPSTAAALEPFLRVDVLRRVVMTFANTEDPTGLKAWAENGQAQVRAMHTAGIVHSRSGSPGT